MVLLSILKLALVALNTVVIALLVIAVAVFDQRAAYRLCQLWAWTNLAICGVRVRVRRLAALDPTTPYVFMSNHRSQYDILAVVVALPEFQLRWVAKKELTRIPVFGWALKRAGHVIIDRSDSAQAVASLRAARAQMLEGISVVIFPEGTRSTAGEALLPLKKGGFMLALETGFPIVPIVRPRQRGHPAARLAGGRSRRRGRGRGRRAHRRRGRSSVTSSCSVCAPSCSRSWGPHARRHAPSVAAEAV